mgnify:CR=1 FL=1
MRIASRSTSPVPTTAPGHSTQRSVTPATTAPAPAVAPPVVWFVVDLFAVAEVGMWYGLTSAKPTAALTKTILFVLVLPLLVMAIPCFWAIAPGLMVAKSVIYFTWAQSKLETQFRRAATERFDAPKKKKWRPLEPPPLRMPGEDSLNRR